MEYTLNVTENEANIILAALGELPAKSSIDLILKLKEEFVKQIQENQEKVIEEGVDES